MRWSTLLALLVALALLVLVVTHARGQGVPDPLLLTSEYRIYNIPRLLSSIDEAHPEMNRQRGRPQPSVAQDVYDDLHWLEALYQGRKNHRIYLSVVERTASTLERKVDAGLPLEKVELGVLGMSLSFIKAEIALQETSKDVFGVFIRRYQKERRCIGQEICITPGFFEAQAQFFDSEEEATKKLLQEIFDRLRRLSNPVPERPT